MDKFDVVRSAIEAALNPEGRGRFAVANEEPVSPSPQPGIGSSPRDDFWQKRVTIKVAANTPYRAVREAVERLVRLTVNQAGVGGLFIEEEQIRCVHDDNEPDVVHRIVAVVCYSVERA